jgi:hypothetical protein
MSTPPHRPAWQMPPWLPQAIDDSWAYVLDDTDVHGPGWWPFHANRSTPGGSAEASPRPCGVRLAPDVTFNAWHTQHLSLYPSDEPGVVDGACDVGDAGPTAFRLRMVGDGWVAEPIGSLQRGPDILAEKTRRAIDFLDAAIAERDRGAMRPTTAADRHTAEPETATPQDQATSATRTRPARPPRPPVTDGRQPPASEPRSRTNPEGG